jgi:FtsZ-binding cell division protein ZapB
MNLRAADDRNEELLHVEDELKQKIETLRVEKKNCQAQLTHMERENARLIEQQQFFECELTSLRSMNRNAESALANVKKAFSEVRIALAETKTRARRRAIETWPRGRGTLRGLEQNPDADAETETDEAIDEAMVMESVGEEVDRELVMDDAADDE